MTEAAISIGSNQGDRIAYLRRACDQLANTCSTQVIDKSSIWETAPWGVEDQPLFLNACVLIETDLKPHELLSECLAIETRLGRIRDRRWGPRLIDIDLLWYGQIVLNTATLNLPHPQLHKRAFVLAPLAEIAPQKQVFDRSIQDHIKAEGYEGIRIVDAL